MLSRGNSGVGEEKRISPGRRPSLQLDLDGSAGGGRMALEDSMAGMANTFRGEGVSVSFDRMRIEGEDVDMAVTPNDIQIGKRIGQGACSAVYYARNVKTSEPYALKMFNVNDRARRSQLLKEVKILAMLSCDALITFHGAFLKEGNIGVILEYMDKGSIEFLMSPRLQITEALVAAIAFQVLWGLGYLHFEHRIHRDIKLQNVLMNSRGEVKLADFGISRTLDGTYAMSNTSVGTFKYMSIERLLGEEYSISCDVWSAGVMLLELIGRSYPFAYACTSPIDLVQALEDLRGPEDIPVLRSCPRTMQTFLSLMLAKNSRARASAGDLIGHPWIAQFNISSLEDAAAIVRRWIREEEAPSSSSSSIPSSGAPGVGSKSTPPQTHRSPVISAAAVSAAAVEPSWDMDCDDGYGNGSGGSGGGVQIAEEKRGGYYRK